MYAVIDRCKWGTGTRPVSETPGAIHCADYLGMYEAVDALSGRAEVLRIPSLARKLRAPGGRLYIAPSRGMAGVLVERVR